MKKKKSIGANKISSQKNFQICVYLLDYSPFVKIFGQVKISIDNNGKEHKNVRILSSKLLKTKEQVKSQDKDKKSILGQIKSFKTDEKTKSNKKDHSKGTER